MVNSTLSRNGILSSSELAQVAKLKVRANRRREGKIKAEVIFWR